MYQVEWAIYQSIAKEESVMKITRIGLDLAKNVFQVHGVDEHGKAVLRRQVPRGKVLVFFASLEPPDRYGGLFRRASLGTRALEARTRRPVDCCPVRAPVPQERQGQE